MDLIGFGNQLDRTAVGWMQLQREQLVDLHKRFRDWESMTWNQILTGIGKKQNHQIPVDQCCKAARDRLAALEMDDVDSLLSLRVNATARVFGILDRDEFKILWWDPNHVVCPSIKKHT